MKLSLRDLAARVESGSGIDRQLDAEVCVAVDDGERLPTKTEIETKIEDISIGDVIATKGFVGAIGPAPRYTDDFEAILRLLPRGAFPLLDWRGCHCRICDVDGLEIPRCSSLAPTPKRALLAAILRLRAEQ